jgi:hypothetical protein
MARVSVGPAKLSVPPNSTAAATPRRVVMGASQASMRRARLSERVSAESRAEWARAGQSQTVPRPLRPLTIPTPRRMGAGISALSERAGGVGWKMHRLDPGAFHDPLEGLFDDLHSRRHGAPPDRQASNDGSYIP